ncbi:Arm DNA-binding domain-containing protein [Roseateles flavus]|uniref:Arm DNA-binding domain-containing protein n=1 Tax=Roseateles flavus TaxID=3149041 RepID=A0ABV0GAV4_9BURK
MYLKVSASRSTRWFLKYRFEGKEKRLALGSSTEVSLRAAGERTMVRRP